jgi:rhodanese-related sulfurtransferase
MRQAAGARGSARERRRTTIDQLLAEARNTLPPRPSPPEAAAALIDGALLIDIREDDQRRRDGLIPGATVMPRNALEWRCDPASEWRHPAIHDHDQRLILLCNEGFQSSLAAATLQRLGLHRATDMAGGFIAWREAGLPVEPFSPARRPARTARRSPARRSDMGGG